jgi:hypothetical protein
MALSKESQILQRERERASFNAKDMCVLLIANEDHEKLANLRREVRADAATRRTNCAVLGGSSFLEARAHLQ